jgi:hypothetical protein
MIQQSFLTKLARILRRRVNIVDPTTDMEVKQENITDTPEVVTLAAAIMVVITEVRPLQPLHNSLSTLDLPEPEISIPCNILLANILIQQCSLIQICDHLTEGINIVHPSQL